MAMFSGGTLESTSAITRLCVLSTTWKVSVKAKVVIGWRSPSTNFEKIVLMWYKLAAINDFPTLPRNVHVLEISKSDAKILYNHIGPNETSYEIGQP